MTLLFSHTAARSLSFPQNIFMRFISPTPFLFLFLFLFLSSFQHAVAQKEISLEKVKDHTGDSVTVKGKVFGIRYLEGARNAVLL